MNVLVLNAGSSTLKFQLVRTDDEHTGVSGHTVARDRRVLHRLFNYAIGKDHLEANPCALVRAPKADPRTPPILSVEAAAA